MRIAISGDPTAILDLTGGRKVQPTDILVQPRNTGMIVGDIQQLRSALLPEMTSCPRTTWISSMSFRSETRMRTSTSGREAAWKHSCGGSHQSSVRLRRAQQPP